MLSRLTWSHYDSGSAHSEDDVALDAAAAAEAQPVGGGTTTGAPGGGSSVAAMALTTSPLHRAALRGHIELVSELLASRAPPTVCDKNHRTPLHYCCCGRDGHRVIAALLLAAGASINAAGISGDTPLMWAAREGSVPLVEFLLDHSADIDVVDSSQLSALHLASSQGHTDVVSLLIERNATLDLRGWLDRTALHWAAKAGFCATLERLLEAGADVNALDACDSSALCAAAENGHYAVVKSLVNARADIDPSVSACSPAAAHRPESALHLASQNNHKAIATFLLARGADKSLRTPEGQTPEQLAQSDEMRHLLRHYVWQWSLKHHHRRTPKRIRLVIEVLLAIRTLEQHSLLARLPLEMVFEIFRFLS